MRPFLFLQMAFRKKSGARTILSQVYLFEGFFDIKFFVHFNYVISSVLSSS